MRWLAAALLLALLNGVSQAQVLTQQALLEFSPDERARIAAHGPWPPSRVPDAANAAEGRPAAVRWGRQLFFDPRLSAGGVHSCATCHNPRLAFQDGRNTALERHAPGERNTPGLLDAAQQRWFGWDGAHDSLWAASLAPLLAPGEMAQTAAGLAARIRTDAAWRRSLRSAFGREVPADDQEVLVFVAKALAAYQATLQSPRTAFDAFRDALVRGDAKAAARYPAAARRGLKLFVGEGRCSICHAGPGFSNGEFADIGVPFFVPGGVDRGRHGGLLKLQASTTSRLGPHNDAGASDPRAVGTRHAVIEPRHFGEFRVPGLRQLLHTAPYMHNGSVRTLKDVVQHYSDLNEERLHTDGERILRPLKLSPGQVADLEAFLRSLSR